MKPTILTNSSFFFAHCIEIEILFWFNKRDDILQYIYFITFTL
jgi:hypothetical protein